MRNIILAACLLLAGGAHASAQAPFALSDGELKQALQQPVPPRFTFTQLVLGAQDEEHQPPPGQDDPHPGMNDNPRIEEVNAIPADLKFTEPFVATRECGAIILVAGVLGWIVLGVAVLVVEGRQTRQ